MKKKSWKDLIFVNPDKDSTKSEPNVAQSATTFPTQTFPTQSTFPTGQGSPQNIPLECAPHMEAIMNLYEKGFTELNQPGIDFFEFYQAVMEGGATNPQAYKMALKMLSGMEKSMTKDTLIAQSVFYINELTKVHSNYSSQGLKKKDELIAIKTGEDQKLKSEVASLKEQLESIKTQIASKETQLSQIDTKYQPKINEFDCKIMANDNAKNKILASVNTVITGIQTNL